MQFIGHDYLLSKGYKYWWGVGRHILGSQVYNYWLDLDGFVVEHFTDGDLVNNEHAINRLVRALTHREAKRLEPANTQWFSRAGQAREQIRMNKFRKILKRGA